MNATIKVVGHGYTENVTFETWAEFHVQDWTIAFETVERLLALGEIEWNEDQPEFFVTFSIIDADDLRSQVEEALAEAPRAANE